MSSPTAQVLDDVSHRLAIEGARLLEQSTQLRQVNFLLHKLRRVQDEAEIIVGIKAVSDLLHMIDLVSDGKPVTLSDEHRRHLDIDMVQWAAAQHVQPEKFTENLRQLLIDCLHSWLTALAPYRPQMEQVRLLLLLSDLALGWKELGYEQSSAAPVEFVLRKIFPEVEPCPKN